MNYCLTWFGELDMRVILYFCSYKSRNERQLGASVPDRQRKSVAW